MKFSYLWAKFFCLLHGSSVRDSIIDKQASVSPGCNVIKCKMGRHSYIGNDSWVINAEIGSFCSIADNVYIGGAMHPMDWCSTSPVFQNIKHSSSKKHYATHDWNPYSEKATIGNDVWIGHGVVINQGVIIGDGAVIGSNAVVTKDVPPYAVVAGVPARVIKYRFDEVTISKLLKSQWWDLPDDVLTELGPYIKEPNVFLKRLESLKLYVGIKVSDGKNKVNTALPST